MKRRDVLAGGLAAIASTPAAAICLLPLPRDPALDAISEWSRASAHLWSLEGVPDEVMDAAVDADSTAAVRALTTVPTSLEGLRAFCEFGAKMSVVERERTEPGMAGFYPASGDQDAEELFMATLLRAATTLLPSS